MDECTFLWYTEAAHESIGFDGLMLEINNIAESGKRTISRNLLRRICKRNDIDTSSGYSYLSANGWIVDTRWRVFPMKLSGKKLEWRTRTEWELRGYKVEIGAICLAEHLSTGIKYFHSEQIGEI